MKIPDSVFAGAATILDVGGWFKPEPRATHVVDLMPWETRYARLTLGPVSGERFSKQTWTQVDFLKSGFRLPYPDKSFDLVLCGHTIEDLSDPEPLLKEMERIGRRGVIECPSRLTEQTIGVRDRERTSPGHPHHHWIVDVSGGELVLFSKADSRLDRTETLIPLSFAEGLIASNADRALTTFEWRDTLRYRFVRGAECERRAVDFVAALKIPPSARHKDRLLRLARRARSYSRGRFSEDFSWWGKIVDQSRPYSTIEIK
jgi:SAM-dependent methyltransferase